MTQAIPPGPDEGSADLAPVRSRPRPAKPCKKDNSHLQGWKGSTDPMEATVEKLLVELGEPFNRNHASRLDFWLPRLDLFIECKRFATPRIAEQLARVDGRDAIVLMGIGSVDKLRRLLEITVPAPLAYRCCERTFEGRASIEMHTDMKHGGTWQATSSFIPDPIPQPPQNPDGGSER